MPKNPLRLPVAGQQPRASRHIPDLPWAELGAGMAAAGWLDVNNRRGRVKVGDLDIEVGGVHDSHTKRDRYERDRRACGSGRRPAAGRDALTGAAGTRRSSPRTATTCCWRATRTAARSASRCTAPWSPTAASTGSGPAGCTGTRGPARSGRARHPALAARVGRARHLTVGPGPVRPAGRRPRCSRWCRGSARLPEVPGKSAAPGVQAPNWPAGCGAAWQRASFGTKRPPVQIRPPRPEGLSRSQGISEHRSGVPF